MPLADQQEAALAGLDLAIAQAREVTDPALLAFVTARIEHMIAGGPPSREPVDDREADVAAVADQMLVDVAGLDDGTVIRAGRHFEEGGLHDLVTASYLIEARIRLQVAGERLWPAP